MKRLVLTVGPPRAGKTTWSQAQGVPIVNPDSVRLAVHGRAFFPPAEPMVWAVVRIMVRSLFAAGHPTVILDATNVTRKRREEWLSTEWETHYRVFKPPVETLRERAETTGREDLLPVIDRMIGQWEDLDESEALREIKGDIPRLPAAW